MRCNRGYVLSGVSLKKLRELLLIVQPLEGVLLGDYAVTVAFAFRAVGVYRVHDAHAQHFSAKAEGIFEHGGAFLRVFYHVEDKAQIDDIGMGLFLIGGKVGVPAGAAVAVFGEDADIVPKAAAKIKEAVLAREDAGLQEQLYRPREVAAPDGGEVPLDERGFWVR